MVYTSTVQLEFPKVYKFQVSRGSFCHNSPQFSSRGPPGELNERDNRPAHVPLSVSRHTTAHLLGRHGHWAPHCNLSQRCAPAADRLWRPRRGQVISLRPPQRIEFPVGATVSTTEKNATKSRMHAHATMQQNKTSRLWSLSQQQPAAHILCCEVFLLSMSLAKPASWCSTSIVLVTEVDSAYEENSGGKQRHLCHLNVIFVFVCPQFDCFASGDTSVDGLEHTLLLQKQQNRLK